MPKLRKLSGAEVIDILKQFSFQVHSQRGSHIKLRRLSAIGKETLTIPNHSQLDTGTCRAILRQASRYIPEADLTPYFYDQ